MAEIVPMPKLGFDMAEGTLVRRAKAAGETIAKGEILADIETDKATVEVEAYIGGVIHSWLVNEGQAVPIGTPMVVIAAPDEKVDLAALGLSATSGSGTSATPTPKADAPKVEVPVASTPAAPSGVAAPASPIARKMAAEANVDLARVIGTGPGGRITKKDVEAYVKAPPAPTLAPVSKPAAPVAAGAEDQSVPLTKMRQIIARRMVESKTTVPHIYITTDIDMAAAMELRKQINALLPENGKASVNDLVVKATALALRQFPNLNASFGGDKIIRKGHVNIGVAVAVPGGLMTVVCHDADVKSVGHIATEVKTKAGRARDGKVQPADIEGSTFSISNLGMFGVEEFGAIINPPEAAILAVGAVRDTPVIKNGAVVAGQRMKVTCCADHRVTDGAEVAQFLQALKKALEEPLRLLV